MSVASPDVRITLAAIDPHKPTKLVSFDCHSLDFGSSPRSLYVIALNHEKPEALDVELTAQLHRKNAEPEEQHTRRLRLPNFTETLFDQTPRQGQSPNEFGKDRKFISIGVLVDFSLTGAEYRIDASVSFHGSDTGSSGSVDSWDIAAASRSKFTFARRTYCRKCLKFDRVTATFCGDCGAQLPNRNTGIKIWFDAFQAGLTDDLTSLTSEALSIEKPKSQPQIVIG